MTDVSKDQLIAGLSSPYVPNFSTAVKMYSSIHAVERDGERTESVKRSLRERFLSWPWKPWVSLKDIQVPNYKPCIYRVGNDIFYHPALKVQIEQAMGLGGKPIHYWQHA